MIIPSLASFTQKEKVTALKMNTLVRDGLGFLLKTPKARLIAGTPSIPNATLTAVTMTTVDYDNDTITNIGSTPTRLTIVTPGIYDISGQVSYAFNATGIRTAQIRLNGTTILGSDSNDPNADFNTVRASASVYLAAGDYIELMAQQSSGAALALVTSFGGSYASVIWVGA